jgi:hypothetical protein
MGNNSSGGSDKNVTKIESDPGRILSTTDGPTTTMTTLEEEEDGSYRLPRKQRGLTIPLIGPIPNAPPLLLGADMILNPPTPFQWKALEESVVVHKNFEQKHSTTQDQHDDDNPTSSSTAIDAAPLVAIIDETSGYL